MSSASPSPPKAGGVQHQGQKIVGGHAQQVQCQPYAPGVDPGLLPRMGKEGRQEHPRILRGKDRRHPPPAPGLQQGFVVVEGGVQRADRAVLHPVEGRRLPGAGGRVLHAAGPGGIGQPGGGQGPVQMMGVQPQGTHLVGGQFHGGLLSGVKFG